MRHHNAQPRTRAPRRRQPGILRWRPGLFGWIASALLLAALAPAAGADPIEGASRGREAARDDSLSQAVAILEETLRGLHDSYIEPIPVDELLAAALEGLYGRVDAHTRYLSPAAWSRLLEGTLGGYVGIGVTLSFAGPVPLVRAVQRGSPAAEAGILPGDRLLAADGCALEGLAPEAVQTQIQGPAGAPVDLELASPGRSPHHLRVTRSPVNLPAIETCLLDDERLAYLRILRFGLGTAHEVAGELERWGEADLRGIVLDLRGNPGGLFEEAVAAADLFLPAGCEITRTDGRLAADRGRLVSGQEPLLSPRPTVVLCDRLTASSAELLAGALRGGMGAELIGEATYGKRTIQRLQPLTSAGALKITGAAFTTPGHSVDSGDPAAAAPLEPDAVLPRLHLPPWLAACDSLGLLARFLGEPTLTPRERSQLPFWQARDLPPALERGGTTGGGGPAREIPGFPRWREQLIEHLRAWGHDELARAAEQVSPDGGSDFLVRSWLADWSAECWGEAAGRRVAIERDPWVRAAGARLQSEVHAALVER